MNITINTANIVELRAIDKKPYVRGWHRAYTKGEKKSLLLRILGSKKYYDCDLYANELFFLNELFTLEEMNKIIEIHEADNIEENILCKYGDKYFWKPCVKITLTNGNKYEVFKSTIEECEKFIEDIREQKNSLIDISINEYF